MFAKHKQGAACLADYRDIKKGGIVPPVNELYAQVEEWLESNEWAKLPDDFGKTFDQELDALNTKHNSLLSPLVAEYNLALARNTANQNSKTEAAQAKIADLDAWYASESEALVLKYFS